METLLNFTLRMTEKLLNVWISILMAILKALGNALARVISDLYEGLRNRSGNTYSGRRHNRSPRSPRRKWAARPQGGFAVPKPPPRPRKRVKAKERSVP